MKKTLLCIAVATFVSFAFTSDKPAYVLYNQKGKEVKYSKMLKDLQTADIVFFGEHHTDPISHWLEYEITVDLHEVRKQDLIIGSEMFEADQQLVMDEYLDSAFAAKKFEADARLWANYKTDYKPVVEFARENRLKYIATNIPRRYASMVNYKGFEALDELSDEAKKYISPDLAKLYDPEVGCYKEMMDMFDPGSHSKEEKPTKHVVSDSTSNLHAHVDTTATIHKKESMHMGMGSKKMPPIENYPKAQAAKDATMAHFILKNWTKGKLFIHFDGAYHSDNFEGIVWWINKLKPGLNIKTISVAYQEDVLKLDEENIDRANYIIAVPETMTQTLR